ncbi:hypothetical protein BS78_05G093600 [Paspalum vaginatum]|nr:hypothetical protein BS78_05G093600 [Paspalum vaginatum]
MTLQVQWSTFQYYPTFSDVTCTELVNWMEATSAEIQYNKEWIYHREHRTVALSGVTIRNQLFTLLDVNEDICELAIRSMRTVMTDCMANQNSAVPERHFLSPEFSKFVFHGESPKSSPLLQLLFGGPFISYDISHCKMFVCVAELKGSWCCYVWDLDKTRLTIFYPSAGTSDDETVKNRHLHSVFHLHPALMCCLNRYCRIKTGDLFCWHIVLYRNEVATTSRYGSGLWALYFACGFDGDKISTPLNEISMKKFRDKILYGILSLPNNEGTLPSIIFQSS